MRSHCKSTENVVRCLLQFIGKHADHGPTVIFKSGCAKELEGACLQMSWVAEPTLPNKWPHNSVLERDIRTLEEVTRAAHLQSGFQIRPGLWVHSCSYAAFVLNLKHVFKDSDNTRYRSAVGSRVHRALPAPRSTSLLPNRPEESLQIRAVRSLSSFRWVATRLRTRVMERSLSSARL